MIQALHYSPAHHRGLRRPREEESSDIFHPSKRLLTSQWMQYGQRNENQQVWYDLHQISSPEAENDDDAMDCMVDVDMDVASESNEMYEKGMEESNSSLIPSTWDGIDSKDVFNARDKVWSVYQRIFLRENDESPLPMAGIWPHDAAKESMAIVLYKPPRNVNNDWKTQPESEESDFEDDRKILTDRFQYAEDNDMELD